jgi:hypothetical protein
MKTTRNRSTTQPRVAAKTNRMNLQKEFWEEFGKDLVVDGQGRVFFTLAGRAKFQERFAKWQLSLQSIQTVVEFKRAMRRVVALELEENDRKLRGCLDDDSVPEAEKRFIRRLLGIAEPPQPTTQATAGARLVRSLADGKARTHTAPRFSPPGRIAPRLAACPSQSAPRSLCA